jgi:hypothetical protein
MQKWLQGYVFAVIVAATITVVQNIWCLSKADWAAWVQAIGTIAAILSAYLIGARQSKDARLQVEDGERRALRRKNDAYLAVAEVAYKRADSLRPAFSGLSGNELMLAFLFNESEFNTARLAMNAIPLYELGNTDAILNFTAFKDAFGYISDIASKLQQTSMDADPHAADPLGIFTREELRESSLRSIDGAEKSMKLLRIALSVVV